MFQHKYDDIIKVENLLLTWERFLRGKRKRRDVILFESDLVNNLIDLQCSLANYRYKHGSYIAFNISDPKPRNIHKATVRDRVLHHIIYKELYPYFEKLFIYDSYSCREGKGTHRALDRFRYFARKVSKNNSRSCYVLKCDIKKFFASIDHKILVTILKRHIADRKIIWLIEQVISSFHSTRAGIGLPLGNLTSQLLVNVYMHEFDMHVKQELRIKYYIRYADDFIILSDNQEDLKFILSKIGNFLFEKLKLELHANKVFIKTLASGVDFLGWVNLPHNRQIRTTTRRSIVRNLRWYPRPETINSYRGLLKHGNTYKFRKILGF